MMLNIETLQAIESYSLWLEITPAEIELARPNPQIYSNHTSLNNAHLNQLCITKFREWLVEQEIEHSLGFTADELTTIWDVVTGCAILIPRGSASEGKTRLILIPTENLDRDELRVPQEWVDLPAWMGDYYLGVQIDLEAGMMNIWGFTSHRSLKEHGEYNRRDRTYSLDSGRLVTNLEILWMSAELALDERSIVNELPIRSLDSALDALARLSIPSPYSPRLDLDFGEWGAILNNPNLRSQLYQTRLQRAESDRTPAPSFRLIDWVRKEFTNAIAQGWQSWEPAQGIVRSKETIERSKLINLQLELRQATVVLLIGLVAESSERMRVIVQVHPTAPDRCLPPQLQLSYLDEYGATLKQVTARNNDNLIQLPGYTCPIGMEFNIQLKLNDSRVIERFVV
jgi:hypothetical protein